MIFNILTHMVDVLLVNTPELKTQGGGFYITHMAVNQPQRKMKVL